MALSSGLDTDQGFDLAEDLIDNQFLNKRIQTCRQLVKSGKGFSEAILESDLFSKTYSSMITIGYKTSAMDDVMLNGLLGGISPIVSTVGLISAIV